MIKCRRRMLRKEGTYSIFSFQWGCDTLEPEAPCITQTAAFEKNGNLYPMDNIMPYRTVGL